MNKQTLLLFCSVLSVWGFQLHAAESPCEGNLEAGRITCSYSTLTVRDTPLSMRLVKYQLPQGEAPEEGWPAVIWFQGSFFPVKFSRSANALVDFFGGMHEIEMIQTLLDNGYAVIAPMAMAGLAYFNVFPYKLTPDYTMMKNLLSAIEAERFGPISSDRLYAGGISSGGYMASEMALSHGDQFKSIIVHSASYARCMGPFCSIPSQLPANHSPTLLISGEWDFLVPFRTVNKYYNRLLSNEIVAEIVELPETSHKYRENLAGDVLNWVEAFE